MAAVTQGSTRVSVWDLRKSSEIRSLGVGSPVDGISWDYTGQYLVAAGPGGAAVEQYSKSSKEWSEVLRSAIPAAKVAWGASAKTIVLLTADGAIRTLATVSEE